MTVSLSGTQGKFGLSFVIPCFNEEGSLEATVDEVVSTSKKLGIDYEMIIYDDGSSDSTGKIADKLAKENLGIKVFHNPGNMGQGYCISRGFKEASKEWVTTIPGDRQISLETLAKFIAKTKEVDFVSGYMLNEKQTRTFYRRLISKGFLLLEKLLFGIKVRYTNGFTIWNRKKLDEIYISSTGYAVLGEIYVKAFMNNWKYAEEGFYLRSRTTGVEGASKPSAIIKATVELIKLFIKSRRWKKK
ncbi:MAG: glycosyltransferase family 2 protein [Candidatus Altiarchaeales archaeon]|nr:glycosyltransferase family 2 protein [Candidatus Altiarchaeales archaeon]